MARVTKSLGLGITLLVACAAHSFVRADDLNDYPTSARVDYVFACMKANGETQRSLDQCSCSIDIIASILLLRTLRHRRDRAADDAGAGKSRRRVSFDRASQDGRGRPSSGAGGS